MNLETSIEKNLKSLVVFGLPSYCHLGKITVKFESGKFDLEFFCLCSWDALEILDPLSFSRRLSLHLNQFDQMISHQILQHSLSL